MFFLEPGTNKIIDEKEISNTSISRLHASKHQLHLSDRENL